MTQAWMCSIKPAATRGLSVSSSVEAALGTLGAEHTDLQKSVMSRQRSLNSRGSLDMLDSPHYGSGRS